MEQREIDHLLYSGLSPMDEYELEVDTQCGSTRETVRGYSGGFLNVAPEDKVDFSQYAKRWDDELGVWVYHKL